MVYRLLLDGLWYVYTSVMCTLPCICLAYPVNLSMQGVLFEPETYRTISKNHNLIAFAFEVPLLLRVLKAAGNNAADSLEVKLAMRTLAGGPTQQPVSRPYLTFASKGHNLNITQDLPVSKPYTASRM